MSEKINLILNRLRYGVWEVKKSKLGDFRQCIFCCVNPYTEHKEDCPVRLAREVITERENKILKDIISPVHKKGNILLCLKDFKMESGAVAFKENQRYEIKEVNSSHGYVTYALNSELHENHIMPDDAIYEYFIRFVE